MRWSDRRPLAEAARRAASPRLVAVAALVLGALADGAPARAAEPAAPAAPAPRVTVTALRVAPPDPGPDTLCQLYVTLRNDGAHAASELGFRVTVGGVDLPAYRKRLFMSPLQPGEARELRLYNFWTTETGRPAPADGRYRVEVALERARWYAIATEAGTEVWTPVGDVDGLPVAKALSVGR